MAELILPDIDELEPGRASIDEDMSSQDDGNRERVGSIGRESAQDRHCNRKGRGVSQTVIDKHFEAFPLLHRHPRTLEGEIANEVKADEQK